MLQQVNAEYAILFPSNLIITSFNRQEFSEYFISEYLVSQESITFITEMI